MQTRISTFKLPRQPLAPVKPRRASKDALRDMPKFIPDDVTRWDDDWPHDAPERAIEWLGELPLSRPRRPADEDGNPVDPSLPHNITELSGVEVGHLHAQIVAMGEWLDFELSLADLRATNAEAYLEHVKAEVLLRKSGTVGDKKAKMLNEARVVEAETKYIQLDAISKLLRGRVKGFEKAASALSREMSRREAEMKRMP